MTVDIDAQDTLTGKIIHLRRGVELQVSHESGKSPAVVFLHGGMGNRFNLRSQYEFFHTQGRDSLAHINVIPSDDIDGT
jgi:hypothetical protein